MAGDAAVTVTAPSVTKPAIRLTSPDNNTQSKQVIALLDYADRVRIMPSTELSSEVMRLMSLSEPLAQLKLALALAQLQQLPALIRAQDTVATVLSNNTEAAQALHPLARLLAACFNEQRRAEDQIELQLQQVRDLQRRLDQTNERLEALVAIERSLSNRPQPVPSKPRSTSLQP
jgi:DNA repair ATPase RecN